VKRFSLSALALTVVLAASSPALAIDSKKPLGFGTLDVASAETVKAQAQAWLKANGKTDAVTAEKFEAIWKQADRPVLDRLADSFALGNADAAKMMTEARDPLAPAPTKLPELLKDEKLPAFFRANLGLAYARALNNRRVHEEALDVLKLFNPEQVVDPAAFLFNRAVSEYSLLMRDEANRSIRRLLDEAGTFSPERFKAVAMLMQLDMVAWKAKDLADISRKMKNVERRLDLARGGPETQEKQKDILARLDEAIKKLENQKKNPGDGPPSNGGECPGGGDKPGPSGPASGMKPTNPASQSTAAQGAGGTGAVDPAKMSKLVQEWGRLPPREQQQALQQLTTGLSPRHREAIENYFRNLASVRQK
jgi:polyhydroxyalkanoate synthesis regulator phasin